MEIIIGLAMLIAIFFAYRWGWVGVMSDKSERIATEISLADSIKHQKKLAKLKVQAEELEVYTSAKEIRTILAGKAKA